MVNSATKYVKSTGTEAQEKESVLRTNVKENLVQVQNIKFRDVYTKAEASLPRGEYGEKYVGKMYVAEKKDKGERFTVREYLEEITSEKEAKAKANELTVYEKYKAEVTVLKALDHLNIIKCHSSSATIC